MTTVALAGCTRTEDPDAPLLVDSLGRHGIAAVTAAWDDPGIEWGAFDATIIRSTWDYPERLEAFLSWARSVPTLVNPADVVAWNADKRYLDDLRAAGVPTIPTTYATSGADASIPDGAFVVKPTVGGGSRGAARFSAREQALGRDHVDELAAMGHESMIQPLIDSIDHDGETDVIVIDGEVRHAVVKHAPLSSTATLVASGPSSVEPASLGRRQIDVVAGALGAVPHDGPLCFARVDLVGTSNGPVVIELELIEPFLFLSSEASLPGHLAAAILHRARGA